MAKIELKCGWLHIMKITIKVLIKIHVPHPITKFGSWVLKFENFTYKDVAIA